MFEMIRLGLTIFWRTRSGTFSAILEMAKVVLNALNVRTTTESSKIGKTKRPCIESGSRPSLENLFKAIRMSKQMLKLKNQKRNKVSLKSDKRLRIQSDFLHTLSAN